jgi:hypothetical protein
VVEPADKTQQLVTVMPFGMATRVIVVQSVVVATVASVACAMLSPVRSQVANSVALPSELVRQDRAPFAPATLDAEALDWMAQERERDDVYTARERSVMSRI